MVGIQLQHLIDSLQRQGVFLSFDATVGRVQQLGDRLSPDGVIDPPSQLADRRIQVSFALKLADDFGGVLTIPAFQSLYEHAAAGAASAPD